eukprot:3894353-Lingulodinium_polyedra.AAC.1
MPPALQELCELAPLGRGVEERRLPIGPHGHASNPLGLQLLHALLDITLRGDQETTRQNPPNL